MSSARLQVLENSLKKKETELYKRLDSYSNHYKQTNGQPMNDKRNGGAFFRKAEKLDDSIRNQQASIEKTKIAIEREKGKIANVESVKLPSELQQLIDEGKITQWIKFPNRFFVVGVEKARLVWDEKKQVVMHIYVNQIPKGVGQFEIFRDVFNKLNQTLNKN